VAESTLTNREVSAITVIVPGTNYVQPPTVTVAAPGTQAEAEAVLDQGEVSSITLISGGSGYATDPDITTVSTSCDTVTTAAGEEYLPVTGLLLETKTQGIFRGLQLQCAGSVP
jgi:hypothetical protein